MFLQKGTHFYDSKIFMVKLSVAIQNDKPELFNVLFFFRRKEKSSM
jgi:hypothetical protein